MGLTERFRRPVQPQQAGNVGNPLIGVRGDEDGGRSAPNPRGSGSLLETLWGSPSPGCCGLPLHPALTCELATLWRRRASCP